MIKREEMEPQLFERANELAKSANPTGLIPGLQSRGFADRIACGWGTWWRATADAFTEAVQEFLHRHDSACGPRLASDGAE
jgi:hypothetical protein